jgi:hypothetical protein
MRKGLAGRVNDRSSKPKEMIALFNMGKLWEDTGDPRDARDCHDYATAGLERTGGYPAWSGGAWWDRPTVEQKFLERSAYARRTRTPIWVGEFGPIYTGEPQHNAEHRGLLADGGFGSGLGSDGFAACAAGLTLIQRHRTARFSAALTMACTWRTVAGARGAHT